MNAANGGYTELRLIVDGDKTYIGNLIYDINCKPHTVEIKPVTQKRTLTANNYYWALLEKLAQKQRLGRRELHQHMLSEYGVTRTDANGNKQIFSVKDGIEISIPEMYIEQTGVGYISGVKFNHYRVLKGSSEMNKEEFCRLLDGMIYECKAQGIETLTPLEIEKLKKDLERNETNKMRNI